MFLFQYFWLLSSWTAVYSDSLWTYDGIQTRNTLTGIRAYVLCAWTARPEGAPDYNHNRCLVSPSQIESSDERPRGSCKECQQTSLGYSERLLRERGMTHALCYLTFVLGCCLSHNVVVDAYLTINCHANYCD